MRSRVLYTRAGGVSNSSGRLILVAAISDFLGELKLRPDAWYANRPVVMWSAS